MAAPLVVHLYGSIAHAGPTPPSADQERLATLLLRLFAPQVLFYGLTTLATALLNAHRRFAAAAFAPVLNNVMLICVLLAAGQAMGRNTSVAHVESDPGLICCSGLGTTAGIAAMALVLWPAITRARIPLRWRFDLRHPAVRQVARLSGWTLGYVVANQVTLFVIISLAFGTPGGGGVSAWTYAYQFFQLPYGIFTVSVMTAFTPELARLATAADWRPFQDRFLFGLRLVVLVLLPSTVVAGGAGPADRVGAAVLRALPRRRRPGHRRDRGRPGVGHRGLLAVPVRAARLLRPARHAHPVPDQPVRERADPRCSPSCS